jgi:hypothetical protein
MVQGDAKQKSVEELLNEASSLLNKVSNGEPIVVQQSVEELEQLGYVCDESGCVLVLPHERESAKGEPCESRGWDKGWGRACPPGHDGTKHYTSPIRTIP